MSRHDLIIIFADTSGTIGPINCFYDSSCIFRKTATAVSSASPLENPLFQVSALIWCGLLHVPTCVCVYARAHTHTHKYDKSMPVHMDQKRGYIQNENQKLQSV